MDLGLNGKVAIVTGGSGGIGSAICKRMAHEGASIVVTYFQNKANAEQVVHDIAIEGGKAFATRIDVRNQASVRNAFELVSAECNGLDILINCAGVAFFHPLDEYPEADWNAVFDTNLKGSFLCCKAAVPYFRARGSGDIINVSSLAASIGSYEGAAYAASKAGVNIMTVSLALELASINVRVNAVAPGRISTKFRRTSAGRYFEFMMEQTPQKRMGSPEEVANAVTFLASRSCSFITGQTLYITGGLQTVYLGHVTPDADSKLRSRLAE